MPAALTNLGGIAVSEACVRLRRRRFALLPMAFLVGGIAVASMAYSGDRGPFALTAWFFTGFFIMGTQNTANAIAPTIYPTAVRSTGAGWALGIGHISQITSPLTGAILTVEWAPSFILWLAALPPLIAPFAAYHIGRCSFPVAD